MINSVLILPSYENKLEVHLRKIHERQPRIYFEKVRNQPLTTKAGYLCRSFKCHKKHLFLRVHR